ncbi:MAG: MATE family efflux transporter [Candidatus Krumholzibacteria bacterium]
MTEPEVKQEELQTRGSLRKRSQLRSMFAGLREAIAGGEQDFTQGSIGRAIFLLSVPMVLEMLMESVFAVVDVYFVATLGPSAVAAVGLTESVLTLIYAVAFGFAIGTTAMIARRIGEKNPEGARVAAVQAMALAVLGAIPMTIVGIFFARDVLALMGADEWGLTHGVSYTRWMLGGNVVIMLIFILNAVFRGAGDAAIAMRVLWLANGINIVLDPALITGWGPFPEMGIRGAAIATNIGRATGVAMQLYVLFFGAGRIRVAFSQMRLRASVMRRLVRVSLGGIGQFAIATSSWIGLMRIMSVFGSEALAGYTIAIRIALFSILPAWGMSNAAATMVGQNLGARNPDRAEKSVWISGWSTMAFLGLVGVVFLVFSEELVRIFTREPAVVAVGADCLRVFSYGYLLYAWGMVMSQAFNGAGDTYTPTVINFFCFWLLEMPLAYLLAIVLGVGERGVYASVVVAESAMALAGIIMFRRGRWKKKAV